MKKIGNFSLVLVVFVLYYMVCFCYLFSSFLSCFGDVCIVVHGCTMVVHTITYYQVLHENSVGMRTVPGLHGGVSSKVHYNKTGLPDDIHILFFCPELW